MTPGACWFVEPQHRLQIEVGATGLGDHPGIFGSDPNLGKDRQVVPSDRSRRWFRNLTGNEVAERERGIDADVQPALPMDVTLKAKAVIASVLEHDFGPDRWLEAAQAGEGAAATLSARPMPRPS